MTQSDSKTNVFTAIIDGIIWVVQNIAAAFYDVFSSLSQPMAWLDWVSWHNTAEDKISLMRFVYYGGSVQFFFVIFTIVLILFLIGLFRNKFMWGCVRFLEGVGNTVGRFFAWAGLIMVLQQIFIIFLQRIFARPDMSFGFGMSFTKDISWFAEELKLYNAAIVCMCMAYTFIQGGHVRVDLVYAGVKYRTKKLIDMVGSILFMMPLAIITWMYGWFFMWRHLIVPKPSASNTLQQLEMKSRALRWNVEWLGFSPNGFSAYFLFKILLVAFAGMVFIQAVAFFMRSYLERKEGPASEGKYLDKDTLGEGEEAFEGTH